MRFARSGALVRVVAAEDACEVCQAMAQRDYLPSDVPRLPVRGCTHESCRCFFVAVDPETKQTVPELVQWGARLIKQGRTDLARRILHQAISLDERTELGWLWLSAVVDGESKIECLEKVLALNPNNKHAAAGLESLRQAAETPPATGASPTTETSASAPPVRTLPAEPPAPRAPVPPQVIDIRQERQVILGQWRQFVEFALNTDAQTLLVQGHAFLGKLDRLDQDALSLLAPDDQPDELRLQLQEFTERIAALQDIPLAHLEQGGDSPGGQAMEGAISDLIRQLEGRRRALREQIATFGDSA